MTAFLDQAFDQIRLNRTIQYLFLAGITCLALVLRLYKLGAWSFWIDEIFTINAAQFVWDWPLERMPLNLLLIHYALNWFGIGEWSARIVPALIGTVSIPILFFPVRRLFGPITAVITAILIATAPWHIFWSQNARFYALLMLFYNIGLLYTLIALEEKRPLFLVIGTFFFLLALREKFTAIFFVPVLGSYFLFLLILPFERPRWLKWQTIFILASPIILFVFYDIYSYIFRDYSQIRSLLVTFWGRSIDDPFRLFSFFTFNITVPVLVLAVFAGLHLMAQKKRSGLYLTLGAVVPLLVTLILTTFTFVKDRYIFTSLISWLILTAVTIDAFWCLLPRQGKMLAVGILCLLVAENAWNDMFYFSINNGHRRDWRGAFALIADSKAEDDLVASSWAELGDYYLQEDVLWIGDITPEDVVASGQSYWFVADSESIWATGSIWPWIQTNAELIDERTLRVPEDMTLWVYKFEPQSYQQGQDP